MSDYSDYDYGSEYEYDDSFYEDNYAGAFGGYDDLYDDVMEEAGYDAWDVENPEFNFDDERPMFDFDPFSEYFDLKDESDNVMMTYQALGELAEMTAKLFSAWEKRAAVDHVERQEGHTPMVVQGDDYSPLLLGLNLYQLELEDRSDLRSYSVWKLARLLGGNNEVIKLRQVMDNISNFVKRIILTSVSNSLPHPMPYPVINTILSYLLPIKGAVNIGPVSTDDAKVAENKEMEKLYLAMAEIFDHVKVIMFNIEPNTLVTEPSITEKKEMLVRKFEVLMATVKSTQLEVSFEGLVIKDIGGAEEMIEN